MCGGGGSKVWCLFYLKIFIVLFFFVILNAAGVDQVDLILHAKALKVRSSSYCFKFKSSLEDAQSSSCFS